jgi:hypothetical protein
VIRSTVKDYIGISLCAAFVLSQAACFADEETSSSVETRKPGSVQSQTYHAQSGQDGAKVSATKTAVQGNPDGSVTASRQHESHAVGAAGSAHHNSAASTTANPDGSTSSVKQETNSTNP